MDAITYQWWDLSKTMLIKGAIEDKVCELTCIVDS